MYLQTPVKLTATWPSSFRFAPEVVCHGVAGFVVSTLEEMMDANGQVNQIELKHCREYVQLRFDVPRMADDYLSAYQRILEAQGKYCPSTYTSSHCSESGIREGSSWRDTNIPFRATTQLLKESESTMWTKARATRSSWSTASPPGLIYGVTLSRS